MDRKMGFEESGFSRTLLLILAVGASGAAVAQSMTDGAVPGDEIKAFVPAQLAGLARSHLLDYEWSTGGAYRVDERSYANLDIQNTFHRGTHDTSKEDRNASRSTLCPKKERVGGYPACVDIEPDGRTSIRWYLPDRLTVRIAAPSEDLCRRMAAELQLGELAKLSAKK